MKRVIIAAAITFASAFAGTARADEPPASAASSDQPKRFYVRLGGIFIEPLSSSKPMELADIDGPASLALSNGLIAGSGSKVDSAFTVGAIIGWRLPVLDRRLSIETVIGVPFKVKFESTGTLATQSLAPTALGIPTGVPPLGPQLGQATAAPPVITAVYSLTEHGLANGIVRPYAGLGFGILFSLSPKVTNSTLTAVTQPQMTVPPAPGLALQAGADFKLYKEWYLRLDVKFIAFMEAQATVHNIVVATPDIPLFGTVEVGTAKMNMTVNPLIVQAAVGVDFDLF